MTAIDLPIFVRGLLSALLVISGSIWLGGAVSIFVVAGSTRAILNVPDRVTFFRDLGRRWGIIGTMALLLADACGLVLLLAAPWTALSTWLVIVGVVLILMLGLGIVQARRISRMRHALAVAPDAELAARIARGEPTATALRIALVLLSVLTILLAVGRALTV